MKLKHLNFHGLKLPIEDYAISGNGIVGIKETGKTYTATWIAERMMDAGIPFIAFDPIGRWRFLKVAGQGQGYPVVVAGGKYGDLPLTPQSAPEIVRAAMRENVPLVIDLFDKRLTKADWRRIVTECTRLLLYENEDYGLRHIFYEEAPEFVPQKINPGYGEVYAEIEKLGRMGGNSGLGYTLIGQRAEEINKAILEICSNLFLHRQVGRNSLTAIEKWLRMIDSESSQAITKELFTLPNGQCLVWAYGVPGAKRVTVPQKQSLHPNRRDLIKASAEAANYTVRDVSGFVSQMSTTLEKHLTEAKENDPAQLKARLRELERQLKIQPAPAPAAPVEIIKDEHIAALNKALEEFVAQRARLLAQLEIALTEFNASNQIFNAQMLEAVRPIAEALNNRKAWHVSPVVIRRESAPAPLAVVKSGTLSTKLPKAESRILAVLAQYPQGRTKTQVAVIADYAVSGGGFNNALGALRTAGYITSTGDYLTITDAGLQALGHWQPLPLGRELLNHWMRELSKAERSILQALSEVWPQSLTKEQIANNAGYEVSGGGFNNALGRLRTLELITGKDQIKASDSLFE